MEFNFAKKQAARNGRNVIIWSVLAIAAVLLLRLFVFQGSVVNQFGPYASFSSTAQLDGLYDSQKHYVTTQAEELFHTGYVMSEDNVDKWNYFVFMSGEEYLICRTPLRYSEMDYYDIELSGKLTRFSGDESQVRTGVIGDVAVGWSISNAEATALVSPYILYVDENRIFDQIFTIGVAAVVVWALICIIRAIVGMGNPATTKSWKKLAKIAGDPGHDPAYMNEKISEDIANGRVLFENKWALVTDGWVADKKANSYAIYPKYDIIWVYRTVTQHRTNGIPSGKSHTINLHTAGGQAVNITAKNERAAGEILETLSGCGFSAVFGFTPELQSLYVGSREQMMALARQQAQPTAPPAQQMDPMGYAPQQQAPAGYAPPPPPAGYAAAPPPTGYAAAPQPQPGQYPPAPAQPQPAPPAPEMAEPENEPYKGPEL